MVIHLLSSGDASSIDCGVPCHPTPDKASYSKITKPSQWHLADHDTFFADKAIAELRQVMEAREADFECTVHERKSLCNLQ